MGLRLLPRGLSRLGRRATMWRRFVNPRLLFLLLLLTLLNFAIAHITTWQHRPVAGAADADDGHPPTEAARSPPGFSEGVENKERRETGAPSAQSPMGRRFDSFIQAPPQLSQFPAGFDDMNLSLACAKYDELLQQPVEPVSQGAGSFQNIHSYAHHGVLLPTLPSKNTTWEPGSLPHPSAELQMYYEQEARLPEHDMATYTALKWNAGTVEFCDPTDADYTPSKDFACLAYLRNPANWVALKPMSSLLSSGRTIKMLLSLRHGNITAVVKLSQTRFTLEPLSETVAFHMDRTLGFRRVPPTAWVPIPVAYIKAAAATLGAFYVHWVEEAVLATKHGKLITSTCPDVRLAAVLDAQKPNCILASVQLWMWDVDAAETTTFANAERKYPSTAGRDEPSIITNDKGNDTGKVDIKTERAGNNSGGSGRNSLIAMWHLVAREHWSQLAFDAIIGNEDRWRGHNSFALAACEPKLRCHTARAGRRHEQPSKSTPRLIYIDQGSGFYHQGLAKEFIFSPRHQPLHCRMHRQTIERLERITVFACNMSKKADGGDIAVKAEEPVIAAVTTGANAEEETKRVGEVIYSKLLLPRLPSKIGLILPHALIKAACRRVWLVLAHRTRCLQANEGVLFF